MEVIQRETLNSELMCVKSVLKNVRRSQNEMIPERQKKVGGKTILSSSVQYRRIGGRHRPVLAK